MLYNAIYLVFVRSPVQAVMRCDAPYRQVCWMECWIETTYRAERIAFSYRRTNHADRGHSRRVSVVRRRVGCCPDGEVQPIWMEARTSSSAARSCCDVSGKDPATIMSRSPSMSRIQIFSS